MLNEQQIQILKFLSEGKTQKEIIKILNITQFQLYKNLKDSIKKLSARNKTEATVKAVLANII